MERCSKKAPEQRFSTLAAHWNHLGEIFKILTPRPNSRPITSLTGSLGMDSGISFFFFLLPRGCQCVAQVESPYCLA